MAGTPVCCIVVNEELVKLIHLTTLAIAFSLSACATVTKGRYYEVKVTSAPPEANVKFVTLGIGYKAPVCVTPCAIELKRNAVYKTTISKQGYASYEVMISPKISESGVVSGVGNIVAGGVVGIYVDAVNGANKDLYPNPIKVVLVPLETGKKSYRTDEEGNIIKE